MSLPLWLRGFGRPRFTLNDHSGQISSKIQQLPPNRSIQTFAWTRRPKIYDLERSKLLQDVAMVRVNVPNLGPSSRIIRRRQFFGRGSQRPKEIPQSFLQYDWPSIYIGSLIGLLTAFSVAYWAAVARARRRGQWEPSGFIERNFIRSVNNLKAGRWWVILTSSFAHFQPLHLIFNMSTLWEIGRTFVQIYGARRFVGTWLLSAFTGSLGSLYWERHQNSDDMPTFGGSIGSSTALCGLMFAQFTSMQVSCVFCFGASVYCLYSGSLPMIGHAGHLGGMAGGVAAYFLFLRRILRR